MLCSGPNLYKLCITDEAQECESLGLHGALFCHCTEKYTKINALNYVALAVCEIAISPLCPGKLRCAPEVGGETLYSSPHLTVAEGKWQTYNWVFEPECVYMGYLYSKAALARMWA